MCVRSDPASARSWTYLILLSLCGVLIMSAVGCNSFGRRAIQKEVPLTDKGREIAARLSKFVKQNATHFSIFTSTSARADFSTFRESDRELQARLRIVADLQRCRSIPDLTKLADVMFWTWRRSDARTYARVIGVYWKTETEPVLFWGIDLAPVKPPPWVERFMRGVRAAAKKDYGPEEVEEVVGAKAYLNTTRKGDMAFLRSRFCHLYADTDYIDNIDFIDDSEQVVFWFWGRADEWGRGRAVGICWLTDGSKRVFWANVSLRSPL